jgi:hypothetical protein
MTEHVRAYPLHWPAGFPRWKNGRANGAFKTDFDMAVRNVRRSIELFAKDSGKKVESPVLSSNVDFNPLTSSNSSKRPVDPGVAVWFSWDGLQVCIPVDRYATPAANLQAIHHIIEARRVELRHGTLALVRATFTGFQALPAPKGKHWRDILEVGAHPTREIIEMNYKRLSRDRHPDRAGAEEIAAAPPDPYYARHCVTSSAWLRWISKHDHRRTMRRCRATIAWGAWGFVTTNNYDYFYLGTAAVSTALALVSVGCISSSNSDYDTDFVESILSADAAEPEARFSNVVDMLEWLNRD